MTSGFPDSWFRPTKETLPPDDKQEREKKEEKKEEEKKDKLLSITNLSAGAIASVTAAFISSFLGDKGTMIGVAVASIITGAGTVIYEQTAQRMASRMPTLLGKKYHPQFLDVLKQIPQYLSTKIIGFALGGTIIVAGVAFGVITAVEASSGQTLHGITTGQTDSGTTLGGGPVVPVKHKRRHHHHHTLVSPSPSPSPSPSISISPSVTPSSTEYTQSPSPSPSSSLSPSLSPSPFPTLIPSPSFSRAG